MADTILFVFHAIVQWIVIPILIVNAVCSWLIAFEIVSPYRSNPINQIYRLTQGFMDPILRPIRKLVPPMGGLDLSPMILIIGLFAIEKLLDRFLPQLLPI